MMKTTIEQLEFPSEIKNKLKIKVSSTNLKFEFIAGHLIKFNKTNLSVNDPHKIIAINKGVTLLALIYDDAEKIYLPNQNIIVSFTKYISILNSLNSRLH